MNSTTLTNRAIVFLLCAAPLALAQTTVSVAKPQVRIVKTVDDANTVTLTGNVHPMVAAATLVQPADVSMPMEHMVLSLKGDATQEAQLAQLIAAQNDPKSAYYHRFLTPQDFGAQFGVADADIAKVASWLESHGFKIDEIPAGKRSIVFSGTAGQAEAAFNTQIKNYTVAGVNHIANTTDPKIPAALAAAVGGVVKLHDFKHDANIAKLTAMTNSEGVHSLYTYGSAHYLSPADYATIYNISPLYSAGINGTGQTIAVLARSNINVSDVSSFRTTFGLKANNPQIVIVNSNPGIVQGDTVETTLDTEWSGAIAPNATVKVIVAASTNTADGIDLSALYAVNNNVAPVVTLSYGSCEAGMGSTELAFYNSLWQQAASQGMSVMVSSGDSGAAGCNGGSQSSGSGQAVNGLCTSPYATCVGGTEFADTSNPGQYWLAGNNPVYGSATGYVPETVWNESGSNGGSGLWAGGGGMSIAYAKPAWQAGPGVPADGKRDVPDVSLTAASHDGYLITYNGGMYTVGGTSASAPSFAGMMALVDQKMNARQGLANTILYPLAAKQAAGGAAVFHDTTSGNNTVPGVKGFAAGVGYDQGSGLGSVDANQLVNHWADNSNTATLSLSASPTSLTVSAGQSGQTTITSTASAALKAAVTLTVAGAPSGVTAVLTPTTIASPGSGTSVLKLTAATTTAAGTYTLTVTGTGGGQTAKVTISLQIVVPTFALTTSATSVQAAPGQTAQVSVTDAPQNGFNSAVALSLSGLPSGVTAAFAPASIGGSGGNSTLTLSVATSAKPGSYALTVTASGGGVTKTSPLTLVVPTLSTFTLAAAQNALPLKPGTTAAVNLTTVHVGSFSSAINFNVSGLPSGVTVSLSKTSVAAPGDGTTIATFTTASNAAAGSYPVGIMATGGGVSQTATVVLTVASGKADFSFALSTSAVTVTPGTPSSPLTVSVGNFSGGFNSTITMMFSGLPPGMSYYNTAATTGNNLIYISYALTASASTPAGTYPVTVSASGAGIQHSAVIQVTVTSAGATAKGK